VEIHIHSPRTKVVFNDATPLSASSAEAQSLQSSPQQLASPPLQQQQQQQPQPVNTPAASPAVNRRSSVISTVASQYSTAASTQQEQNQQRQVALWAAPQTNQPTQVVTTYMPAPAVEQQQQETCSVHSVFDDSEASFNQHNQQMTRDVQLASSPNPAGSRRQSTVSRVTAHQPADDEASSGSATAAMVDQSQLQQTAGQSIDVVSDDNQDHPGTTRIRIRPGSASGREPTVTTVQVHQDSGVGGITTIKVSSPRHQRDYADQAASFEHEAQYTPHKQHQQPHQHQGSRRPSSAHTGQPYLAAPPVRGPRRQSVVSTASRAGSPPGLHPAMQAQPAISTARRGSVVSAASQARAVDQSMQAVWQQQPQQQETQYYSDASDTAGRPVPDAWRQGGSHTYAQQRRSSVASSILRQPQSVSSSQYRRGGGAASDGARSPTLQQSQQHYQLRPSDSRLSAGSGRSYSTAADQSYRQTIQRDERTEPVFDGQDWVKH